MTQYLGITINYDRDNRLSEQAIKLMEDYYMYEHETSPQEAFARASVAYCCDDLSFAQRIYDYASKGWFMFASPVLSNAPDDKRDNRGLPISCFLTYVGDSLDSLIEHNGEVAWLSVKGGGVGGHWGDVRGISDKAPGPIPFMKVVDAQMTAYKQGKTRKGSYAAYLDVSHPDIEEFINFKVPTGGDINRKCLNLFNAVNLTDDFMQAVVDDTEWQLKDPDGGVIRDTVKARKLWQQILSARFRTGSPYLNFIDTARRHLPEAQKKLGLKINGSNLCNEIHLATNEDRTAVCCLSSVNLERYDEWKKSGMVGDLVKFLDNVLQYFIDNAPKELSKAVYSASRERSIGLGAMGFHGYLQSKGLAWKSLRAASDNYKIFKDIKSQAVAATYEIGYRKGECRDGLGLGMRNMHLLAIAPNANSSILCGCSASIEPSISNCYVHRTRAGSHTLRNPYLLEVLQRHGQDNEKTWKSIIENEGSVQHLVFLTDNEKDVFKTAFELDQALIVEFAAKRQEFICQGQSVNVFFASGTDKAIVNQVHLKAWKEGLKGLYYLRTTSGVTAEQVGTKVDRNALRDFDDEECLSCQG
tara:strand:- start:3170 stop:4924 length:1755 start_codon:yes stop_codon:yes gene_type:complete